MKEYDYMAGGRGYSDSFDEYSCLNHELSLEAGEPETVYRINKELNLAHTIIEETGENLFLTGKAGTGKTTFLNHLRESSSKMMVVLAPTGVAAINAGGNTIHSFFQLPLSPYVPGQGFIGNEKRFYRFNKLKRRIIASMSLLVIDEVSMVRPDILDGIDSILRRYRHSQLPFGGVQLLLIGDLRQLPPVVKEEEWQLLSPHYESMYFFESHALKRAGFQTIELTSVFRQSDQEFISILNNIRDGKADRETIKRLNSRFIPDFNPADSEGYIRLTTHNRLASGVNSQKLSELKTKPRSYQALIKGEFPEPLFPVEKNMTLKVGAQVMFVKNDIGADRRYYNGMLGTVTALDDDKITVRSLKTGNEIEVERVVWENTRYVVNESEKEIRQESIGEFMQFPLRLAWAITIHKSQGLTFEKAIIDAALSFAPGQTYVALSRCKSLEGLVLGRKIPVGAIITDSTINSFVDYCENNVPVEGMLENMQADYVRKLLCELFGFADVKFSYKEFMRYVEEYISPVYPEVSSGLLENFEMLEEMELVGNRFLRIYASESGSPNPFDRPEFLSKVRNGCAYFSEKIKKVLKFISRLPRDVTASAKAERLNKTYENLSFALDMRLRIMEKLEDTEFSVPVYLHARSAAILDIEGRRQK